MIKRIRVELRKMIFPKNPCDELCPVKNDNDYSECNCHKCPVDWDNWCCILEQLGAEHHIKKY